jgi:ParB-like chromosome segregation protein Spo0J
MTDAPLKFHPLADIFPLMEGVEFDELVADIKAHGLHEEIVLFDGMILDGRNRYRACLAADVAAITYNADKYISDPATYVVSANLHRRHLTQDQRRALIAKLVKAQPEKSDRQIAKTANVDHKTVASVRSEIEERGEIPHVEMRTDSKGRKQPTKKPANKRAKATQPGMDPDRDIINTTLDLVMRMDPGQRTEFFALLREKFGAEIRDLVKTVVRETVINVEAQLKKRGRPKGSKNKPKSLTAEDVDASPQHAEGNAIGPEKSAEIMRPRFAALDSETPPNKDGLDIPGFLRRDAAAS